MSVSPFHNNITINQNIKVLFVDDDAMSHLAIATIFSQIFHSYETANDTTEALEKFDNTAFDLLITEVNMKNSDGLAFIQKIRTKNKLIPIIVLSNSPDTNDFIELIQSDIEGFISKPIKHEEILNTISKTIEKIELKNTIENHKK
jgi:CheY-like chemotaxis protein